jgi:hypothetical protein
MWRNDGSKLTGTYGTWQGHEWELWSSASDRGNLTLVQDGGEQPGQDWKRLDYPNRFARTPVRYYKDVDAAAVSEIHTVRATAKLDSASVELLAENDEGRLAVHTLGQMAFATMRRYMDQFGFERFENAFVFGWVEPHALQDLNIERTERAHTA